MTNPISRPSAASTEPPPLTAHEVAALQSGDAVQVVWSGGNGPHNYIIHKHGDTLYAGDPRNDNPLTGETAFVGQERYHTRVWRLERAGAASTEATPPPSALTAAIHDAMCDVSHHDRYTTCKNERKYEMVAESVHRRLRASTEATERPPHDGMLLRTGWHYPRCWQAWASAWYPTEFDCICAALTGATSPSEPSRAVPMDEWEPDDELAGAAPEEERAR